MEALRVRVDELYRRVADLERTQPAVIATEVRGLREDVAELRDEIRELREDQKAGRRASYATVLSVAGGIAVWAITAWQVWGNT